jgi:hypothetical protein
LLNISQADTFQNVSKNNNIHILTKGTLSGSDNHSKAEKDKGKGKAVPVQPTKVYGKRRGIAPSQ